MLSDLTIYVRDKLHDIFLLPGEFLLAQFTALAPGFVAQLGITGDERMVLAPHILSLLCWILIALAGSMLIKLWQNLARILSAFCRTIVFRASLAGHNIKTSLVLTFRKLMPKRLSSNVNEIPMVEFDDLDLAVLRSASAQGPGFALSAPELADKFVLRPAQIQVSLDRLRKNRMLDYVIGSTEGFDNYRLTDYGAAFVAMWRRQEKVVKENGAFDY